MDQSNSAPTTAWPMSNDTSSATLINPEEPVTSISLPQRRVSEWEDDLIFTAYPQTSHPREDLLGAYPPPAIPHLAASSPPVQSPTSAYPPTPFPNQSLRLPGHKSENDRRISSKYAEFETDIQGPYSARLMHDIQEPIKSSTSIYHNSNIPYSTRISRKPIAFNSAYQKNAHAEPSHSSRNQVRISELTQSPVADGAELFPEFEDTHSRTTAHTIIPQLNLLDQNPSQQAHIVRSHPQNYQTQLLAPPEPPKSNPPTRTARSSSIIIGLDQGLYRPPSHSSHHSRNLDNFYASQKDDSRLNRQDPLSRDFMDVRRSSSFKQPSILTQSHIDQSWPEQTNRYQQPFTPANKIPTYQEFRLMTKRVDSPRSDQFPLPAHALSQYQHIYPALRPARESDLRFDPNMVQKIYEERWQISNWLGELQGWFKEPKGGVYKDLEFREWIEVFENVEERDRRAVEREIIFQLKGS